MRPGGCEIVVTYDEVKEIVLHGSEFSGIECEETEYDNHPAVRIKYKFFSNRHRKEVTTITGFYYNPDDKREKIWRLLKPRSINWMSLHW